MQPPSDVEQTSAAATLMQIGLVAAFVFTADPFHWTAASIFRNLDRVITT